MVRVRGKQLAIPPLLVGPSAAVVFLEYVLRIGEVHDELWLTASKLPSPAEIIEASRRSRQKAEAFTFAHTFPRVVRRHPYPVKWDNLGVPQFDSYADWLDHRVDRSVQKHIRKSIRDSVVAEAVPYTDTLVKAIRPAAAAAAADRRWKTM